jgi:arginine deiminase
MSKAERCPPRQVLADAAKPDHPPPLPNPSLYTATTAWVYGGVILNPMHWPARRLETLNLAAILLSPDFKNANFPQWWAIRKLIMARNCRERVMPINGCVPDGMGERDPCSRSNCTRSVCARRCNTASPPVPPKSRSAMHLIRSSHSADRDLDLVFSEVTTRSVARSLRPTDHKTIMLRLKPNLSLHVVADAEIKALPTGG